MNRKTVFYLEGHEDDAARAFLGDIGKKIISYQEVTGITNVFHADLSKQEKQAFLFKKRGGKGSKNRGGVQKGRSLRENDVSLAFFYIRGTVRQ